MGLLSNSVSGLLAAQRNLATTGNNIANVNTEGFSRQRVDQAARPPQGSGDGFIGRGTEVANIRRVFDQFLSDQRQNANSAFESQNVFADLAGRVDNLLADADAGLTPSLQRFFNAVQEVADDPASIPARQVMLSEAESLANRFDTIDQRLADLEGEINGRVRAGVDEINGLTRALGELNQEIGSARAQGRGEPSTLLDRRDQRLNELSELVRVDKIEQDDGSINVFAGNGTPLVLGDQNTVLEARRNAFDPGRLEVARADQAGSGTISDQLNGGRLGGLLDFRDDVLDPTRNRLGRIATGLAQSFNATSADGVDLRGDFGDDFFSVPDPVARPRVGNTGGAVATASVTDAQSLTAADYRVRFSNGTFEINRVDSGESVNFSDTGTATQPSLEFDGLKVDFDTPPDDGDAFLVQPTRAAAGGFERVIDDPREIAAAAPIIASPADDNLGSGQISLGEVTEDYTPGSLSPSPVEIEFTDEDEFTIDGATPAETFSEGEPIEFNDLSVTITGQPAVGDKFVVEPNSGGTGDNRNAERLAGLVEEGLLDGGNTSLQDAVGEAVADVATLSSQAQVNRDAQQSLRDQARESLQSVSGVNLDEEAANLLRFQQAFQASAQSIRVADTIFQSLLSAVSR